MDKYLNTYPFKRQNEISIEQRAEDYSKEIIALCKNLDTLPTNGINLQEKLEQAHWEQFEKYSTIDYPRLKEAEFYPITLKKDNLDIIFTSGEVKTISLFYPLSVFSLDIRLPDDDNYEEAVKEFDFAYNSLKKAFINKGYQSQIEFAYLVEEMFLNAAFFQVENVYILILQYDCHIHYNFTLSGYITSKKNFEYYKSGEGDISKLFISYYA